MLLHICLGVGGLALLYALFIHLRNNRRVSGGFVLAAAMLTIQAIIHPSAEQVITQQLNEESEGEESENPASLEKQMLRQAKRIRSGQIQADLTLQLPSRKN